MAVYVSPLITTTVPGKRQRWRHQTAAHMIADTPVELDEFARKLRLKPEWKQDRSKYNEHYDLTESKRIQAIALGAQECSHREINAIIFRKKDAQP